LGTRCHSTLRSNGTGCSDALGWPDSCSDTPSLGSGALRFRDTLGWSDTPSLGSGALRFRDTLGWSDTPSLGSDALGCIFKCSRSCTR